MRDIKLVHKLLVALFVVHFHLMCHAQIDFKTNSEYRFLKGVEAVNIDNEWYTSSYDDSSWPVASAPFRYGDGAGGTELLDMQGNYSTVFLRSKFNVSQAELLRTVTIGVDWDDGFILWINGQEVLSQQAPSEVAYNSVASGLHESGLASFFTLNASDLNLVNGENTIAVLGCNITLEGSSDFYYDMSISAQPELPLFEDSLGISFSHKSGYYSSSFYLSIATAVEDASIVYTLDGSNPQTSSTRITDQNNTTILINPNSTNLRASTPAVIIRASIMKDGFKPSVPEVRTFIFMESVKSQSYPGGDWPDNNVNGQLIDLDMDPEVTNSSEYGDLIDDALLDIPTISVVTANDNMFNSQTGIYVNARQDGPAWERECAVELINPDGSEGFNVNAGIRIRGGASRRDENPKHAFRLFFREEYGTAKLNFPLFGDEGVDEFDKIDLRCAQNYSWNLFGSSRNTFIREVFARDSQAEQDQPYTRSRYYHLYLNGMYWGLFQTQERSEARYAESYFGDDHENYDVIKIGGSGDYNITATDGTTDKWREVWERTQQGFATNSNYFALEGKDAQGKKIEDAEVFVDIDNLIDYMINIFYSGNYDAPVSAFFNNKAPNNFYAITNRVDKAFGFKFFVHDAEHTLKSLDENRVNIADNLNNPMIVENFEKFHAQWLHHKLSGNEEYRVRFADRAYELLTGNGVFTPQQCIERFERRAQQINMAIIAESARWGDAKSSTPKTKHDAWLPELNYILNDYFPYRTGIVENQMQSEKLYASVKAPVINDISGVIFNGVKSYSEKITLTLNNPGTGGQIYYTTNGEDPRNIGGSISNLAKNIASGNSINISGFNVLKARIFYNNEWSALREITFLKEQEDYADFKITEMHYHPLDSVNGFDTISGKSFEFIEFKNTSYDDTLNLSGVVVDSAIYYEFPEICLLEPQAYFVIASKPSKFYDRYKLESSGNFKYNLSNGGERIVIVSPAGDNLMDFIYNDSYPWVEEPDGEGPSLVSTEFNPKGSPSEYYYWTFSKTVNGNPFSQIIKDSIITDTIINAPIIEEFGVEITGNIKNFSDEITISVHNPQEFGELYYTFSGKDPGIEGGNLSDDAKKINSGSTLNIKRSLVLMVRILKDNQWSLLRQITFLKEQKDYFDLKVTEIHYNPLDSINGVDTISGKSFEFIEFKNTSYDDTLNLSGVVVDSAIYYEFPEICLLEPQAYFVIASKPTMFYDRYKMEPSGKYQKNLSNSGEQIILTSPQGNRIMDFTYDDNHPWPVVADGYGPSMISTILNPVDHPGDSKYWTASSVLHGTPFYQLVDSVNTVNVSEPLTSASEDKISIFPNPTKDLFNVFIENIEKEETNVKIFNVNGTLVYSSSFYENISIDLSSMNINYGLYLVVFEFDSEIQTRKVIYRP